MRALPGMYADGESGLIYNGDNYYDPRTGRWIKPDGMSVAEHVLRWRSRMGVPGAPSLEINPYVRVLNNPLRWIDLDGFESESPNVDPSIPDPSVPEPGLESPCIECIIVPAARAGKIAKTCIDIAKKEVVQKACKSAILAAALGTAICEGKPPRQFPRDKERVEDIRKATEQTLRKNTGGVRDR